MKKQYAFSMGLSRGVVVADEQATAFDVAKLMEENDIGAVVILRGDELVGIVSERDITRRVVAKKKDGSTIKVSEFMTRDVITCDFKEGIDEIYKKLCEMKCRHLPIVDKGKLVGIASQRDVLYNLSPRSE